MKVQFSVDGVEVACNSDTVATDLRKRYVTHESLVSALEKAAGTLDVWAAGDPLGAGRSYAKLASDLRAALKLAKG